MARDSGLGGLIVLLGLALLFSKPRGTPLIGGVAPAVYYQYREWATTPAPSEEVPHATDPLGTWREISPGRIPTPRGPSIPTPIPFPGGIIDVNKMLKPVGVITPTYTPPKAGVIDITAKLIPVEEKATEESQPPRITISTARPGLRIR